MTKIVEIFINLQT